MKKDCSEHQNRVLRKLVRSHKPSLPAMSGPMTRKATLPFPVGRRTTRSEAAKLRAERDSTEKVSQLSKFDSNSKQSDDSAESTDSQSELKQNPTMTNDNQSETNSPQETAEEKAKKPRKKRISRALFRHDTIELIKPKKQELLQKTFSCKFKKLVDKSKEIYTKNDELSNDNENDDKNKEDTISEESDCTKEVKNPSKNTENSSYNNNHEERTVHNKRLILDMPSLDSPSSPIRNSTEETMLRISRIENINNNNRIEKLNKPEQNNIIETNKSVVPAVKKKMTVETNDNQPAQVNQLTHSMSGSVCQIQTNSSQNLAYPFYGIVPTRQPNTAVHKQETTDDQMPKYKITIVPDHPKNKTSDNRTVPPQQNYPVSTRTKFPQQYKIKTHAETKNPEKQPFPYSYLPPKNPYGYPYHLYPYLPPIQTKKHSILPEKQFWNPHIEQRKDNSVKLNMSPKEALKYKIQQNGYKNEQKTNLNCTVVKEQHFPVSKDQKQNKNQLAQVAHNLERLQNNLHPLKVVKSNLEHLKHISQPENHHLAQDNIRHRMPIHPPNYEQALANRYQDSGLHGQKRPAEEPKLSAKRLRFDSNLPQTETNNFPTPKNIPSPIKKTESVIVSPNSRREINEQRVIVSNTQEPPFQSTCSVIKKVTTNKNLHTIENILSIKCSKQEVNNNNDHDKIKILNIEAIPANDNRYVTQNAPQKSVIINVQSTKIAHIDLTTESNEDRNSNPLTTSQFSDTISLNDNTNRLAYTQNTNADMTNNKNIQQNENMATDAISKRHMPKLVKIPEYLNKHEEPKYSEKSVETKAGEIIDKRMHKYPLETKASEIKDNRKHNFATETNDSQVHKYAAETKASEISDNRMHTYAVETKSSDKYAIEKIKNENRRHSHTLQSKASITNDIQMHKYAAETNASEISDNRMHKYAVETKVTDKYAMEKIKNDNRGHSYTLQPKTNITNDIQVHKYAAETKTTDKYAIEKIKNDNRGHPYTIQPNISITNDIQVHKYTAETEASETRDNRMHKYAVETKSTDKYAIEKIKNDNRGHPYTLQPKTCVTNDMRHKYSIETKASDKYAIRTKESETNNNRVKQYVSELPDSNRIYKHRVETNANVTYAPKTNASVTYAPESNKNVTYVPEINKNDNRGNQYALQPKTSETSDNRVYKSTVETKITDQYTIKTIESNNRGHRYVVEPKISETNDHRVYKYPVETNTNVKYPTETNSSVTYTPEINKNDNRGHEYPPKQKPSETSDKRAVETNTSVKYSTETNKNDNRAHKYPIEPISSETSDNRAVETKASDNRVPKTKETAAETKVSDEYAYKNVPLIKPAHINDKLSDVPLNLSLKTVAQNEQTKRQSIIVNNTKIHEPLDLSSLTLVKSDEEYNGYLKLLQEKNATGPYLFYKFVTSVRRKHNQPIFDLVTFFSLLKQGKLLEYKNMYNQCNK